MKSVLSGLCLLVGVLFAVSVQADINLYVVPPRTAGVTPTDPYTTWDTAATNIQTAINAAKTIAGYNTVVVTSGVYNLDDQLTIDAGMAVRSWKDGALDRTNTVIVGGPGFRCVEINHTDAVLSGFTITNGSLKSLGGGVYINTGGGTVSNCIITGNSVEFIGAGVYQRAGLVVDCLIAGNLAHTSGNKKGAGVYASGGKIIDSQIINNLATNDYNSIQAGYGGGMYINGPYTITRCEIAGNTNTAPGGASGGGLYITGSGSKTISNSVIRENYASNAGGGMYLRNLKNMNVVDCEIISNYPGGIHTDHREPITDCRFANCVIAGNNAGVGGGVRIRTDIILITFQNCLIAGNKATYGGGMETYSSVAAIDNCSIVGNSAYIGGGIYVRNPITNRITNCIIYDNENTAGEDSDIYLPESASESTNCFFYSCAGSVVLPPDQGNRTDDPKFVGPDNYRLLPGSPCINTGVNLDWMEGARDLDGHPRLDAFTGQVDMGCYEYAYQGTLFLIR